METTYAVHILLVLSFISCVNSQPRITTTSGDIQGSVEIFHGNKLYKFLGIPFAKPPVGDLRFMKPQPPERWSGVKNTTKHGPSCMQGLAADFYQSEDCLSLNLYVPGHFNNSNDSKAVMVWIYGGGYTIGGSTYYVFDELAVDGEVIVVTVNYRLSSFGFLSTGDVNAPGNAGLWDQIEGIKWVRDNIANFGGDPNRITLFGESAGSSSVSQLAMTTAARGLFHRFIAQSGAALSPWAWQNDADDLTTFVSNLLGCKSSASETARLVRCLQGQDAMTLLKASVQAGYGRAYYFGFSPVVDGDMFPRAVTDVIKDEDSEVLRHFRSLDYIAGFTDSDGGLFLYKLPFDFTPGIPANELRDKLIPKRAAEVSADHAYGITEKMREIYLDPQGNMEETGRQYVNLLTDLEFAGPTITGLTKHLSATNKSSYLYSFTKIPSWRPATYPPWFKGSNHADDVAFVLGPSVGNLSFTEDERKFTAALLTYWSNFAKTGNPNVPKPVPAKWETYTVSDKNYLDLGENIKSKSDMNPKRMEFWLKTIPQILSRDPIPSPTSISKGNYCRVDFVAFALYIHYWYMFHI